MTGPGASKLFLLLVSLWLGTNDEEIGKLVTVTVMNTQEIPSPQYHTAPTCKRPKSFWRLAPTRRLLLAFSFRSGATWQWQWQEGTSPKDFLKQGTWGGPNWHIGHLRNAAALVGEGKKGRVLEGVLSLVPLSLRPSKSQRSELFFHSSFKEGAKGAGAF